MLTPVAADVWDVDQPFHIFGMSIGHRMTVVRLPNGSLWVHSPVEFSEALAAELSALGPVRHIVAPSIMHDTFLEEWLAHYPHARTHGAPGLARSRPDLTFSDTLGEDGASPWAGVLEQHTIQGMPRLNEVVFLHVPTRSLIITDLCFNLGPEMPLVSRLLLTVNDCYCKFGPSRLLRSTISHRADFRKSRDTLLQWDFDRIIVGHGSNVESGGKEKLRAALAAI